MSERIVYLNLPRRPPSAASATSPVIIGNRYQMSTDNLPGNLHGLCGGLEYTIQHGRILAPLLQCCYLWDIDDELGASKLELNSADEESITLTPATNVRTSHFVWSNGSLSEPKIVIQDSIPQLTITAGFDFVFSTAMHKVQLGLLSLVETQRFAMLKNGERYSILDSGETGPVLYLTDGMDNDNLLTPVLETGAAADTTHYHHEICLSQHIPERLNTTEIENLTVLEQYTTFFMQRSLAFSQENIWTPVCAPITWGWSMRVTKRHDGDWCIIRQKLLMPTVGHNGLEMPLWEGNQLGR